MKRIENETKTILLNTHQQAEWHESENAELESDTWAQGQLYHLTGCVIELVPRFLICTIG